MNHLRLHLAALAALGVIATGAGGALAATQSASGAVKVSLGQTALGRILVDGRGRTLYLFEKDTHGKSNCVGACPTLWPPLIASGKPLAGGGVKASLLGTTRRSDGRLQVTYNRHPLYMFFQDTRKGLTKGEGQNAFGAEWYAVSRAGATVEKGSGSGADASTGGSGSQSGGSYGSGGYGTSGGSSGAYGY